LSLPCASFNLTSISSSISACILVQHAFFPAAVGTQEAEIRMFTVWSQLGQLVPEVRSSHPSMPKKNPHKFASCHQNVLDAGLEGILTWMIRLRCSFW
jgi:hypothetical protein